MRGLSRRRPGRTAQVSPASQEQAPPSGRFADRMVECETCGRSFVFTVEEQRQLAAAGRPVEPPSECPRCAPRAESVAAAAPPAPRVEPPPARPTPAPAPPPPAPRVEPPAARRPAADEPDEFSGLYTVRSFGHVKWYDPDKGYGFILSEDDGHEYFVHQSALEGGIEVLIEGQAVEFEIERKPKGPEAAHVLLL